MPESVNLIARHLEITDHLRFRIRKQLFSVPLDDSGRFRREIRVKMTINDAMHIRIRTYKIIIADRYLQNWHVLSEHNKRTLDLSPFRIRTPIVSFRIIKGGNIGDALR